MIDGNLFYAASRPLRERGRAEMKSVCVCGHSYAVHKGESGVCLMDRCVCDFYEQEFRVLPASPAGAGERSKSK